MAYRVLKQRLQVLLLILSLLGVGGCRKTAPAPAPVRIPQSPTQSTQPIPPPTSDDWKEADHEFTSGNYAAAAQIYESVLGAGSGSRQEDLAWFRLGVIYLSLESPVRDPAKGVQALHEVVQRFPGSELATQAGLLLQLSSEVERLAEDNSKQAKKINELSNELDKLKAIDQRRRKSD